jgi:hypothetical protein
MFKLTVLLAQLAGWYLLMNQPVRPLMDLVFNLTSTLAVKLIMNR